MFCFSRAWSGWGVWVRLAWKLIFLFSCIFSSCLCFLFPPSVIHHSSLSFCLICLLGLLLIVLSVFVTNLTVRVSNLHCYLRVPLFNLGFMLSFGALFLKSYALHKVFNNPGQCTLPFALNLA